MSYGVSSPLGIAGIIFIVIGIIMAVIGIILLIANQNKPKAWYIWFLMIVGILLGIAGGIMLAVALMQVPSSISMNLQTTTETVKYVDLNKTETVKYVDLDKIETVKYVDLPKSETITYVYETLQK